MMDQTRKYDNKSIIMIIITVIVIVSLIIAFAFALKSYVQSGKDKSRNIDKVTSTVKVDTTSNDIHTTTPSMLTASTTVTLNSIHESTIPSGANKNRISTTVASTNNNENTIIGFTKKSSGVVDSKDVNLPKMNDSYGLFRCKRLDMLIDIFYGDNAYCLHNGIGQSQSSLFPGFGRPTLLSGHNSTYCSPLQNAQIDDIFELDLSWGYYKYQVYDIEIYTETDASIIASNVVNDSGDDLVLYTCYPFGEMNCTQRLFLYCKKLSGPIVEV